MFACMTPRALMKNKVSSTAPFTLFSGDADLEQGQVQTKNLLQEAINILQIMQEDEALTYL
jgi:histidyl-tRNA synthetase